MSNRREFLKQAAYTGGALALGTGSLNAKDDPGRAAKPLSLLILGGTGFIGPHHVNAAVARGHKVSVFNRGKSDADLPAGVERLVGDRTNDLEAIKNRDWDAVLDLAVYVPSWVRSLGEALKGRVKHYTYISTESVYEIPEGSTATITEDSPVRVYKGPDPFTLTSPGDQYGAVKVLCEREAEKQFPGKTLVLRPDYIVGPGDPQGHLVYWPTRMQKGGEILVAGSPATPAQFVDIRDMAAWAIRMIEQGATGTYNTIGPVTPMTFGDILAASSAITSTSPKLTWVPASFVSKQPDSASLGRTAFWSADNYGNRSRLSNARAVAKGFKTRPYKESVADTFSWFTQQPADEQAKLLRQVKKKEDGSGYDVTNIPWPAYLEREKEVLAAWKAEKSKQG